MPRLLITTADKRSWSDGSPAVFLGKWCLRPGIDNGRWLLNSVVAEPFYPDLKERLELSEESRAIYHEVMAALYSQLNERHNVNYSQRRWEILIGPFLIRYIRVIMNRYLTLGQCLHDNPCDYTIQIKSNWETIVPEDTLHFINLTDNDFWNNQICAWLINDFFHDIKIETVNAPSMGASVPSDQKKSKAYSSEFIKGIALAPIEEFNSRAKYYIHDIYSSRLLKLRFNLLNKQIPINRDYSQGYSLTSSKNRVEKPFENLIRRKTKSYHIAIERYLVRLLPFAFLEGYGNLVSIAKGRKYPLNPRAVITSTAFDTNEVFKEWVGSKVDQGSKYIVLQHGAAYGVNPLFSNTVEESTSDAFITWGWTKSHKHLPGFCPTTSGKLSLSSNPRGRLLLVEMILRRRKFIWDVHHEFDRYLSGQFDFLRSLENEIRHQTTVRLHAAHVRSHGDEKRRFDVQFPEIEIDDGINSIWKSLGRYRIVIFSYDSTGILELMNKNFPMLAFWDATGFDQYDAEAAHYYDMLRDAGILHFNPASAARFLGKIWGSIDSWWKSDQVTLARECFCRRYASRENATARNLNNIVNIACNSRND